MGGRTVWEKITKDKPIENRKMWMSMIAYILKVQGKYKKVGNPKLLAKLLLLFLYYYLTYFLFLSKLWFSNVHLSLIFLPYSIRVGDHTFSLYMISRTWFHCFTIANFLQPYFYLCNFATTARDRILTIFGHVQY